MVSLNIIKQINSIPILEIAPLIVPKFHFKGKIAIGQCIFHEDNILNNLKFNVEKNYAHCFTCSRTWSVYRLIKDFGHFSSAKQVVNFLNTHGYQIDVDKYDEEIVEKKRLVEPWKNILKNHFVLYALEDRLCNQIIKKRIDEYQTKIEMIYNQLLSLNPSLKKEFEQEKNQLLQFLKARGDTVNC